MAAKKKAAKKPGALERLVQFLDGAPAVAVGKKLTATDAKLAAILASTKKHDPRVHAFVDVLVRKHTSFCIFDVEAYPEQLLRGKRDEPWNEGGRVVGANDVCLARNGGGDIWVWSATDGSVRFLVHDEGWKAKRKHADVDAMIEDVMQRATEDVDLDQLEEADEGYLARLRFAFEIAGSDDVDDEVREKLEELRVL